MAVRHDVEYNISCVIPAFNEAECIEGTVTRANEALLRHAADYEIIVVDDGSVDDTIDVLRSVRKTITRLTVISHETNLGYGAALRTGFLAARMPLIFYTDADNQFDPGEMSLLLPHTNTSHIVAGYRVKRSDPPPRLFFSRIYNSTVNRAFGTSFIDINCAFKIFRREIFHNIAIDSDGFFVDAEILVKATRLDMKITEVGVHHFPRTGGHSKVRYVDIADNLSSILKMKFNRPLKRHVPAENGGTRR